MYNKTGNIVARFLSRHAVLTLNGFNSLKDLLSHFAKVSLFPQITKQFKQKADKTLKKQPLPDFSSRKIVKIWLKIFQDHRFDSLFLFLQQKRDISYDAIWVW